MATQPVQPVASQQTMRHLLYMYTAVARNAKIPYRSPYAETPEEW
jgi:hypothetical protein